MNKLISFAGNILRVSASVDQNLAEALQKAAESRCSPKFTGIVSKPSLLVCPVKARWPTQIPSSVGKKNDEFLGAFYRLSLGMIT